ncbi:MAG TPA: cellulose synthase subunit BcsC-related outer membrane protein [Myxococcales bacterium]|nr:cellulose synthase subunit BcsC-related outer membrane protein [Myxococcales bacterium]
MSRTRALIAVFTLASAALADDLVSGLVRNAWYWQARARSDKAEDAWKQVLEAAPENPEALAAVGGFSARAGRMEQARQFLARLEKASPGHPDVPVLRREIELGPRFGALLAQARKLVHESHVAEGAAKYRELFGAAGPPGDLALEYYQSISGTPGGWQEARDGLRRMARRAPHEVRYKLALAKLLTYREETRREGIGMLAALSKDSTVGKDASSSLRQALLWLSPSERDAPLFREWLKAHPGDTEMAKRLDRARKASTVREGFAALDRGDVREAQRLFDSAGNDPDAVRGRALIASRRVALAKKAGFAALDRGDLAGAQSYFESIPQDADARLGLALIAQKQAAEAQRQEDFPRARELLERARKLVPDRRDVWEAQLRSVQFWSRMHDAKVARAEGRGRDAEAALRAALENPAPRERWQADLALANLLLEEGRRSEAEAHLRDVLGVVPNQPEALRALAGLLVQQGRFEEAIPVNTRLAQISPQAAFRPGWLQAEMLRSAAARSRQERQFTRAREQLQQARRADPSDLWVLHDLANVLLQLGDVGEAQGVVSELLRVAPDLPEARVTQARLLVAQREDVQALEVLRSIPAKQLDPAASGLRRQLELQIRIPQLLQLASSGRRAEAVRELTALEREAQKRPELAAQIAVAWARMGETARAVGLMREAMARSPEGTRGARLELASTLLDAGDDAFLGEILRGLERDPSLDATERRSLGDLRVAHAVRVADRERGRGDLRAAESALAEALRDYPRDARLLAALARAREQEGETRSAHALYLDVLAARPEDPDALRGAVDTALALGDLSEARTLVRAGLSRHPDDPHIHQLAAHLAEREGDDGEAMGELRRASALARNEVVRTAPAGQEGVGRGAPAEGAPRAAAQEDTEALRTGIARDMQRIDNRHRPALGGGFEFRQRQGEAGMSALTELRGGPTVEVPVAFTGRLTLRIEEVQADAGNVAATALPRFGTGALVPAGAQRALGTELHATYESRHLVADIGTTPLGFPVFAPVGGVRVRGSVGPLFISAGAASRSVNESFVSMAAATDPATGRHWGGVLLQGGRLDLSLVGHAGSVYAYGEAGRLIGLSVQANRRFAAGAGAELILGRGDLGDLRIGPAATVLAFDNNERFFTFGHGGYFSPQRFVHGGAIVRWQRGGGGLRWDFSAEPGYDYYQEAHAPIFPLDPDGAFYPGKTEDGFSFTGRAFIGVGVGDRFELGFSGGVQRAPEFQEVRAGIVLRAVTF